MHAHRTIHCFFPTQGQCFEPGTRPHGMQWDVLGIAYERHIDWGLEFSYYSACIGCNDNC